MKTLPDTKTRIDTRVPQLFGWCGLAVAFMIVMAVLAKVHFVDPADPEPRPISLQLKPEGARIPKSLNRSNASVQQKYPITIKGRAFESKPYHDANVLSQIEIPTSRKSVESVIISNFKLKGFDGVLRALEKNDSSGSVSYMAGDYVLVKLKNSIPSEDFRIALLQRGFDIKGFLGLPDVFRVSFRAEDPLNFERAIATLGNLSEVEWVEPDFLVETP